MYIGQYLKNDDSRQTLKKVVNIFYMLFVWIRFILVERFDLMIGGRPQSYKERKT